MTHQERNSKFGLMAMLFVTCFVVANIIAFKRVEILGFIFPSAVFAFLLAFSITDIVTEIWGKKAARELIVGGFVANVLAMLLIQFAIALPPAGFWAFQSEFEIIMGSAARIAASGMIVFVISKNLNIFAFDKIRSRTGAKHLWLRNNGSSFVAQLVDTILFQLFAFAFTMPWRTLHRRKILKLKLPTASPNRGRLKPNWSR